MLCGSSSNVLSFKEDAVSVDVRSGVRSCDVFLLTTMGCSGTLINAFRYWYCVLIVDVLATHGRRVGRHLFSNMAKHVSSFIAVALDLH